MRVNAITLESDTCENLSVPNMPPPVTSSGMRTVPANQGLRGMERTRRRARRTLWESHKALCVRNSIIHGIPHIMVRIAVRCVLHRGVTIRLASEEAPEKPVREKPAEPRDWRTPTPRAPETGTLAVRIIHRITQSVGATGGVYKGQGRNQHELMTRAY
eukprot:gene44-biopygen218